MNRILSLITLFFFATLLSCGGQEAPLTSSTQVNQNEPNTEPGVNELEASCPEGTTLNEQNKCVIQYCKDGEQLNSNQDRCLIILTKNAPSFNTNCPDANAATDLIGLQISDQQFSCLTAQKNKVEVVIKSSAANDGTRFWSEDGTQVALFLQTQDNSAVDVSVLSKGCQLASVSEVALGAWFALDFSHYGSSCVLALTEKASQQTTNYQVDLLYGLSVAKDFKIPFFAQAARMFVLTRDIDLTEFHDHSSAITPEFYGQLDGRGHRLDHLAINANEENRLGLFGQVNLTQQDATVKIHNLQLTVDQLSGNNYIGGLVGYAYSDLNSIEVDNIVVHFNSPTFECLFFCGGLIGQANGAKISQIKVIASNPITLPKTFYYFGGMVGYAHRSNIRDVTAQLAVSNTGSSEHFIHSAGLVLGFAAQTNLERIDAAGSFTLSEGRYIGGVVGSSVIASTIKNVKVNLTLEEQEKKSEKILQYFQYIGGVVGYSTSTGHIQNVAAHFTANLGNGNETAKKKQSSMGGIAGYVENSALQDAFAKVNMDVKDFQKVGGVIGNINANATLNQVFVTGKILYKGSTRTDSAEDLEYKAFGQMIGSIETATAGISINSSYAAILDDVETDASAPPFTITQIAAKKGASLPIFKNIYNRSKTLLPTEDINETIGLNSFLASLNNGYQIDKLYSTKLAKKLLNIPDVFNSSSFGEPEHWTNSYLGKNYVYPMLQYPQAAAGWIAESDWFDPQIQSNQEINAGM